MVQTVNVLFFDMNSYFASVFQAEERDLVGKPLGVVTTISPRATCIAASVEAKKYGVRMGTRMAEAQKMCPGIQFRAAKHDMFVDYHHRIRAAVETVIPIDKVHSVDECSCKLLGRERDLNAALQIGADVQRVIKKQVSTALRCSVGVAPNKLLAKLAAEMKKPEGLNWLTPDVLPDKIAGLQLDDIPGISRGILGRLTRAGIHDVPSLYAMSPKAARHLWRSVEGERFLRQLHGETVIYPDTKRSSLGHGQILTPKNRTPEGARLVARRLLVKAASRLRREGFFARTMYVSFKNADKQRAGAEGSFPATQDTFALLQTFDRYWGKLNVTRPLSVSMMLGGLHPISGHIGDLFEDRPAGEPTDRERLCSAIDALNIRFGQDTIRFGELPPHRVPYTGAKIAFGRIPDPVEFSE
ncbi:type VI secretion protein ImpB [Pseudaestuariivita rosea]|uniref:Y-family DNA polymerase n=1 Tax=Pseudaestuariivita rosea TaxID=2763263 RepID=UPI001ABA3EC8|nr:type VI secretion protein ImpB [Pseudaestuariivita rosea]